MLEISLNMHNAMALRFDPLINKKSKNKPYYNLLYLPNLLEAYYLLQDASIFHIFQV